MIENKQAVIHKKMPKKSSTGYSLKDFENRFRALFDNTYDAIFLMKGDTFIDCNPRTEVMFGCSREELIGKRPFDFSPPIQPDGRKSKEKAFEKISKAIRGIPQSFEWTHCRKNGVKFDTEVSLNRIEIEGELLLQAIIRDITQRKTTEAELRNRVDFEKFIASISTNFINLAADEIDQGIQNALEDIGIFVDVDRSFIFLLDSKTDEYTVLYEWCNYGIASLCSRSFAVNIASIPWWHNKLTRFETIRIADVSILPSPADKEREMLLSIGTRSILCAPLRVGKSLIGFFGFDSVTEKKDWSMESLSLLRLIGEIISNALERKRRDEKLRRLADQRKRLLEVSSSLLTTLNLDEVLQQTLEVLKGIISFDECSIHLVDRKKKVLQPYIVVDEQGIQIESTKSVVPLGKGIVSSVLESGIAEMVNDAHNDPRSYYPKGKRINCEHIICAPMRTKHKLHGTFLVVRQNEKPFTVEEFELVQLFVGYATIGLENAELYEELNERLSYNARLFNRIKSSEERYRKLFEDSKDGVFTSTYDGNIIDINPAGIEMLGYNSKEELEKVNIGQDLYVNPKRREEYAEILKEKGYLKDFEAQLRRKDGQTIDCLITSSAYVDDKSGKLHFCGFIRDVTKQKKFEAQMRQTQKIESLGQLACGIAHDFNNVLGIIQGGLSALRSKIEDKDSSLLRYVDMCESAGERGADVARRLLTFSQSDKANRIPLKINDIVNDLTKVLRHTIQKNISIETNIPHDIPPVFGEYGQLYQMLLNLCVNARDAIVESQNGIISGTIGITVEVVDNKKVPDKRLAAMDKQYVRIRVSDSGVGLSEHIKDKIYDPFFTTKIEGTGLGLSIVYGIVKLHQGVIDVVSEEGKGTVFSVYIPTMDVDLTELIEEEAEEIVKGNNETILIIEDEKILCTLLGEILTENGYQVMKAVDGEEAWKIYCESRQNLDAVVLDMGLPKLSGQALFEKIIEKNPEEKIILASGYLEKDLKEDLFKLGAKAYIQKPYKASEILRNVQKALNEVNG